MSNTPTAELHTDPATPVSERCVTSYPVRRAFRPGVVYPPAIPGVAGMIDIHCHAHEGQQDALSLAKVASENQMGGLLFKTVGPISGAEYRPARVVDGIREQLKSWSDDAGLKAAGCWAGYGITMDNRPPSLERLRQNIEDGIVAVWLPVFNHANTLFKVGGKRIWWDKSAAPSDHTGPLPWDEAIRCGFYLLDEHGKLKPEIADILRAIADANVALFFGHATHREIFAIVELLDKLNFKRAVIDHPFSPFVDLDIPLMKQLTAAGVYLNFTYDELSPLLGVDPARMYEAIRAVGVEYVTLSSDAGEPLFPNSAECMRLVSSYMAAFGLNAAELEIVCHRNPSRLLGLDS
ncbi:hypothetical protein SAMN05216350_101391 [Polaromonas sp. YR568]|uniref:DUF6282 family protein n=1 Tax=Polaromonas sp. YR568 TaxID=1855301 RepID=UPI0008F3CB28|nr:DUF6282 family protein [Polaromonas sp. YR568]SFU33716.1 hypothetical protein SAMN05216350_101391 [Polaromonas sp. YR568]